VKEDIVNETRIVVIFVLYGYGRRTINVLAVVKMESTIAEEVEDVKESDYPNEQKQTGP